MKAVQYEVQRDPCFRHPLGTLEYMPWMGARLYCISILLMVMLEIYQVFLIQTLKVGKYIYPLPK